MCMRLGVSVRNKGSETKGVIEGEGRKKQEVQGQG